MEVRYGYMIIYQEIILLWSPQRIMVQTIEND